SGSVQRTARSGGAGGDATHLARRAATTPNNVSARDRCIDIDTPPSFRRHRTPNDRDRDAASTCSESTTSERSSTPSRRSKAEPQRRKALKVGGMSEHPVAHTLYAPVELAAEFHHESAGTISHFTSATRPAIQHANVRAAASDDRGSGRGARQIRDGFHAGGLGA